MPTGPDYWCNQYFDAITNGCDSQDRQDKKGGTMYAQCVVWSWDAFDGCTGKGADAGKCGRLAKQMLVEGSNTRLD